MTASLAQASDWQIISGSEKLNVFVDKSSIARSGKYKKAWFMYSNSTDQTGLVYTSYKVYRSNKALEYFDCEERTTGQIQSTFYAAEFGAGDALGSMILKLPQVMFSEVVPDTIGETMLNYICSPVPVKKIK